MDRQIKFRAWDEENKEMVNITSLIFWHDGGIKLANNGDVDEHKVMQFTGLFDKNGKEIWEGDIVDVGEEEIQVKFEDGAFVLIGEVHSGILSGYNNIEVVGNTYENPLI